eukprot:gene174-3564_t
MRSNSHCATVDVAATVAFVVVVVVVVVRGKSSHSGVSMLEKYILDQVDDFLVIVDTDVVAEVAV